MAKNLIKTPFGDRIGEKSVPDKGSKGGVYDKEPNGSYVGHDTSPNGVAELYRDTAVTSKSPSLKGPINKTPFKDSVD